MVSHIVMITETLQIAISKYKMHTLYLNSVKGHVFTLSLNSKLMRAPYGPFYYNQKVSH